MRATAAVLTMSLLACSREATPAARDTPEAAAPSAPSSASTTPLPEPKTATIPSAAPTSEPPPPPKPLPTLAPFLQVLSAPVPASAYARRLSEDVDRAAPGFDPKVAKPESVTPLADGAAVLAFGQHGPSDLQWTLAVRRDGKIVATYGMVRRFVVEPKAGLLALVYTKVADGKKRFATDVVDLKTLGLSPLPTLVCVDTMSFDLDGTRLVTTGFSVDKDQDASAEICVFDAVGKLLARLDGGTHILHAAASHFVRMPAGVLREAPTVVWAMREYQGYGDFDLTMIDTAPPHAVKIARLPTPAGNGGALASVELDFTKLTLDSTEVRYRGKNGQGWYWQWTTRPLRPVLGGDAGP